VPCRPPASGISHPPEEAEEQGKEITPETMVFELMAKASPVQDTVKILWV